MLAVKSLCNKGILLEHGQVTEIGPIDQVVNTYSKGSALKSARILGDSGGGITVESISFNDNGIEGCFEIDQDLVIKVKVTSEKEHKLINTNLFFHTAEGSLIFATCSMGYPLSGGQYVFECTIPANNLNDNLYMLDIMVVENAEKGIVYVKDALAIEGNEKKRDQAWLGKFPGLIRPMNYPWKLEKLS
jgi:lipopolysaccharide transport system ATP-binding protein